MSDDFGHIDFLSAPFLERITREERLREDHPRKRRYIPPKPVKKDPSDSPSDGMEKTDDSTSSQHIDLRI
jgi:hypothetical protein